MTLRESKYVAFTTFTKDGTPKSLPVWIVDLGDGRLGFTTSSSSWKVKRLRNDRRVVLQESDSRGRPTAGSEAVEGLADTVDGENFETVKELVRKKYGLQFWMITLVGRAYKILGKGSGTDTAVIVTLDE